MPLEPPPIVSAMVRPTTPPPYPYMAPVPMTVPAPMPAPPPPARTSSPIGMMVAAILGLALLIGGLILALRRDKRPMVADAELSNVRCDGSICTMDITFKDTMVPGYRVSGYTYTNGERISIRYDPSDPTDVAINFIPPIIRPILGWFLVVVGLALLGYAVYSYRL